MVTGLWPHHLSQHINSTPPVEGRLLRHFHEQKRVIIYFVIAGGQRSEAFEKGPISSSSRLRQLPSIPL